MADREYHRKYWQSYKHRTKQVSLTLTLEEYRNWKKRAADHGRKSVGQQIKAEAFAYQEGTFLPTEHLEDRLSELIRIMRGIGNNLNQIAHQSNQFARVLDERKVMLLLGQLERDVRAFVEHRPPFGISETGEDASLHNDK